jgi:hypothetical protein
MSGCCAISARHSLWTRISVCLHEYSMTVLHISVVSGCIGEIFYMLEECWCK